MKRFTHINIFSHMLASWYESVPPCTCM